MARRGRRSTCRTGRRPRAAGPATESDSSPAAASAARAERVALLDAAVDPGRHPQRPRHVGEVVEAAVAEEPRQRGPDVAGLAVLVVAERRQPAALVGPRDAAAERRRRRRGRTRRAVRAMRSASSRSASCRRRELGDHLQHAEAGLADGRPRPAAGSCRPARPAGRAASSSSPSGATASTAAEREAADEDPEAGEQRPLRARRAGRSSTRSCVRSACWRSGRSRAPPTRKSRRCSRRSRIASSESSFARAAASSIASGTPSSRAADPLDDGARWSSSTAKPLRTASARSANMPHAVGRASSGRHGELVLGLEAQRLAAGHQHLQPRRAREQLGRAIAAAPMRCSKLSSTSSSDRSARSARQRVGGGAADVAQSDRRGDGGRHQAGSVTDAERDERRALLERRRDLGRRPQGEPRLADAARAR